MAMGQNLVPLMNQKKVAGGCWSPNNNCIYRYLQLLIPLIHRHIRNSHVRRWLVDVANPPRSPGQPCLHHQDLYSGPKVPRCPKGLGAPVALRMAGFVHLRDEIKSHRFTSFTSFVLMIYIYIVIWSKKRDWSGRKKKQTSRLSYINIIHIAEVSGDVGYWQNITDFALENPSIFMSNIQLYMTIFNSTLLVYRLP